MKQKFYEMVELAESAAEDFREHNDDRAIIWASKRITELEVKVEAYRHANGSKADRIQKMKEQHEEAARSWKQYIAELKEHVTAVRAASDDVIASKDKRIAELEAQNFNMMALFRDFYELEFNRDECWEIIKKYGGDA